MLNSKFQIPKHKQITIPNEQNYKLTRKFWQLEFWICILFVICGLYIGICNSVYALNLDKIKVYFLAGDYKSAILEGERLLASEAQSSRSDELYYVLGLSYLKDGNHLRASDIFEIILKEFKNSAFRQEAELGLGDTYFLRGDYDKSEGYYKELLNSNSADKLKAQVYYRLSQVGFKKGDTQEGREYLEKLKKEFPASTELLLNRELGTLPNSSSDFFYNVQVGSFTQAKNAHNLTDKLIQTGYDAYIEETDLRDTKTYRVKVGKLKSRTEAVQLQNKLSQEGYPTRICP